VASPLLPQVCGFLGIENDPLSLVIWERVGPRVTYAAEPEEYEEAVLQWEEMRAKHPKPQQQQQQQQQQSSSAGSLRHATSTVLQQPPLKRQHKEEPQQHCEQQQQQQQPLQPAAAAGDVSQGGVPSVMTVFEAGGGPAAMDWDDGTAEGEGMCRRVQKSAGLSQTVKAAPKAPAPAPPLSDVM